MFLAAVMSGMMTVFMGGQFAMSAHGVGERKDCGTHVFHKDDGLDVTVVIKCEGRVPQK